MNTITKSDQRLRAITYSIEFKEFLVGEAPLFKSYVLRDAELKDSWETFGASSLPAYFTNCMDKFSETMEDLSNLQKPLSKDVEKELPFMLNSLLYVRKLIAEVEE